MEKPRNVSSAWEAEATSRPEEQAGVAQLVEYKLPKLGVAGSNPVARSISRARSESSTGRLCFGFDVFRPR